MDRNRLSQSKAHWVFWKGPKIVQKFVKTFVPKVAFRQKNYPKIVQKKLSKNCPKEFIKKTVFEIVQKISTFLAERHTCYVLNSDHMKENKNMLSILATFTTKVNGTRKKSDTKSINYSCHEHHKESTSFKESEVILLM